jgi:type I restriction enzyme R subunit
MFDKELQKEYNFLSYMAKVLPNKPTEKVYLDDKIKLEYYRLDKTFEGNIVLEETEGYNELKNPKKVDPGIKKDPKSELLEVIIKHINERFNGIFTEGDKVIVETMYDKIISGDKKLRNKLKKQAKNNNAEVFQDSIFPKIFKDIANDCYTEQMDAFTKLFENQDFYNAIMAEIGREAYRELRNQ